MRAAADPPLSMAWLVGKFFRPELSATFIVKGTFTLKRGAPAEPLKEAEHCCGDVPDESERPALRYSSDFAPYKPHADILLVGTCYAPQGKPVAVLPAALQVGGWRKSVAVIGDRIYRPGLLGGSVTEPQPFTSMPLLWSRSLGGAGFEKNPVGRGLAEEEVPKLGKVRLMPNIDNPDSVLASPSARAEPYGLGPIDPTWRQRKSKAGTYDKKWLKGRWPWFPEDFEPSFFNAAPEDQQLRSFLKGDEQLLLENLNKEHPRFEAALPGVRPRCLVEQEAGGKTELREVALVLDTLWIDADAHKLVLVWRGSAPVKDLRMSDITGVFAAVEKLSDPRVTPEVHRDRLVKWLKGDDEEEPEPPEEAEAPPQEASVTYEQDLAKVNNLFAAEKSQIAAARQQGAETLVARGRNPAELDSMQVPSHADLLAAEKEAFNFAQAKYPQIAGKLPPPHVPALTPSQPPQQEAEDAAADEPGWTREKVEAAHRQGFDFADQDLSGLDLSGLDLSGGRFFFAIFTEAKLANCKFTRADLRECELGKADLTGADFEGAQLKNADFSGGTLTGARFVAANVAGAEFNKCQMDGCDFSKTTGKMASFHGSSLKRSRFLDASLPGADFDEAAVEGADFSRAMLDNASFEGAKAKGATFEEATITKLHGAGKADFSDCNFKKCQGKAASFESSLLTGADFSQANLGRADFSQAKVGRCRFQEAELASARFADADLTKAVITLSNCCKASFERCDLSGADLRQSNFYEAEFWEARLENALNEGSNFKATKLA